MTSTTSRLDWDSDVVKHYIRLHAWLPAAHAQIQASRKAGREPNYLTFCAANAVDVFLFLREGLLARDPHSDVVLNTYFCEKDHEEFNHISQLIGAHDRGFFGGFEDMILFKEDDFTRGKDIRDTSRRYRGKTMRERLNTKERHRLFRAAAPFDVINLDICGAFFPPRSGEQSPMLRSMQTLLDWHTTASQDDPSFRSFTMFVSTHMEAGLINQNALDHMINLVDDNRATNNDYSNAVEKRFGTKQASQIASDCFVEFYCVALPKVIISEARARGWRTEIVFSGRYERIRHHTGDNYSMLAWVGRFTRNDPAQLKMGEGNVPCDYPELIKETIREPKDVDHVASMVRDEIEADLAEVVSFRQDYQDEIRSDI